MPARPDLAALLAAKEMVLVVDFSTKTASLLLINPGNGNVTVRTFSGCLCRRYPRSVAGAWSVEIVRSTETAG